MMLSNPKTEKTEVKYEILDEFIKDYIIDIKAFSSILNFEDLIIDPSSTFKILMKTLEKNIMYF